MQSEISVTPAALKHIQEMLIKRGKGIGMRLMIKDTGCSGKTYKVELIDETSADDHVYPVADNIVIAVDSKSYIFVVGTTIDYVREKLSCKFVFNNPNEKASCGCGESFYA
jgi:iron-sulfur cluster assembly protein